MPATSSVPSSDPSSGEEVQASPKRRSLLNSVRVNRQILVEDGLEYAG
jgi:hypothetical protein